MDNFFIAGTNKTPEINFKSDGTFLIKGNSYAENVGKFYLPLVSWFDAMTLNKKNFKSLNIELNYVNTSSIKQLLTIITKINTLVGGKAKINWVYEKGDEDMLANGEDLQELSELKFNFVIKDSTTNSK